MEYLKETQEIVNHAQEKKYVDFKEKALQILKQKTAEKMAEMGYFKRLDQSQGIFEDEEDKEEEKEEKEDKEEVEEEDEDEEDEEDEDEEEEK